MTRKHEQKGAAGPKRSEESLGTTQKLMFGLFCWGVQSWNAVDHFKENGYTRKYHEARKAMYTGLVLYGIGILMFVLFLI